jgi:hypothetical protein
MFTIILSMYRLFETFYNKIIETNHKDITENAERIAKIKTHSEIHGEKRKFLGVVAGMVFDDNEKAFALKNGFYVIEPSGETFNITPPEGQPREWYNDLAV